MSESINYIPNRIKNAAVGGHVCGAVDIVDDALGLEQSSINEDVAPMPYNDGNPNGMGRIILKKTDNFKNVVEAQSGNTIFVIKYDFTLTDNVTIPANCVLEFDGGSISGGILIGNETIIQAGLVPIFNDLYLNGTWKTIEFHSSWFELGDDDDTLEYFFAAFKKDRSNDLLRTRHHILDRTYNTTKTLVIGENTTLNNMPCRSSYIKIIGFAMEDGQPNIIFNFNGVGIRIYSRAVSMENIYVKYITDGDNDPTHTAILYQAADDINNAAAGCQSIDAQLHMVKVWNAYTAFKAYGNQIHFENCHSGNAKVGFQICDYPNLSDASIMGTPSVMRDIEFFGCGSHGSGRTSVTFLIENERPATAVNISHCYGEGLGVFFRGNIENSVISKNIARCGTRTPFIVGTKIKSCVICDNTINSITCYGFVFDSIEDSVVENNEFVSFEASNDSGIAGCLIQASEAVNCKFINNHSNRRSAGYKPINSVTHDNEDYPYGSTNVSDERVIGDTSCCIWIGTEETKANVKNIVLENNYIYWRGNWDALESCGHIIKANSYDNIKVNSLYPRDSTTHRPVGLTEANIGNVIMENNKPIWYAGKDASDNDVWVDATGTPV